MKNIIKNIALYGCVLVGVGLASCEDFLTITPTSSIVEEDFWQDKTDLQNGVAACYTRLLHSDIQSDYIIWGEMRGDNFEQAAGSNSTAIKNLMNGNLLPTSSYFDWTPFYNEINYCNKVLAHGEDIVAKDESFSSGDWLPIKAEMMTLRALSHYILMRTFGEVPYVTVDYNNDSQDFLIAQSTQEQVLDSIIADLEECKEYAMNDYGVDVWNKGRVTKKTVYTLLADVYLWRASYKAGQNVPFTVEGRAQTSTYDYSTADADYRKCIEYCDWVINAMKSDRKEYLEKYGKILGGITEELTIEDLLYPNETTTSTSKYALTTGAYNHIFGSGNSQESIFELQVDGTTNTLNLIGTYFWNFSDNVINTLQCSEAYYSSLMSTPNTETPDAPFAKTDYRRWETCVHSSADQTSYPFGKYRIEVLNQYNGVLTNGMQDNSASTFSTIYSSRTSSTNDANWIFYRLSDVLLMKAEAMSQVYTDEEHLSEAFKLCRDIYKRSNPYAYSAANKDAENDSLNADFFSTPETIEALVMAERQREFYGEGKRWYDLVRYAQRRGTTEEMLKNFLGRKYTENRNAVFAKLATMQSLFSPIYNNEIKNNSLLHQNSVWSINESSSKTDDL